VDPQKSLCPLVTLVIKLSEIPNSLKLLMIIRIEMIIETPINFLYA